MKFITAFVLLMLPLLAPAGETQIIAYPDADNPSFLIEVPGDWELEQAEEDGAFFHLNGPSGAVHSFRTIEGTQDSLEEAIKESLTEAGELFNNVEVGDPMDWTPDGLTGFYVIGNGVRKDDGTPVRIGMAWCALKDGNIVEMWFAADQDDEEGMEQANAIANSLKSP